MIEYLLNPYFIAVVGMLFGYFLRNTLLYAISAVVIVGIGYISFSVFRDSGHGLGGLGVLILVFIGALFLGCMWLVAVVVRWKYITPYLKWIKIIRDDL